jgi:hypothetical protein
MTKLLEQAFEKARRLTPAEQDDIARAVIALAGAEEKVSLTPDERAAVDRSKAAASRGDFATEDEVSAVWTKHGR